MRALGEAFCKQKELRHATGEQAPRWLSLACELNSKTLAFLKEVRIEPRAINKKPPVWVVFVYGAPLLTSVEHLCKKPEKPYDVRGCGTFVKM